MNPFFNPYFLSMVIKSYYLDSKRLHRMNAKNLKRFQDKSIRKIVRYAYNVPLYKRKYKNAGIHPDEIKKIQDIHKLPLITKNDIKNSHPKDTIPPSFNLDKAIAGSTSGTTGKPATIYGNMYTAVRWLSGEIRVMREQKVNWYKTRITIIDDLSYENNIEKKFIIDGMISSLKTFFSMDNIQIFDMRDDIHEIMNRMNRFKPEYISSFPGIFRKFAILKRHGYGKDIWPKSMTTVGAPLDKHSKKLIEDAFKTRIFDAYGATEAGPIGFQCNNGKYHINSDMVFLETVDDEGESVSPGSLGHLIVTRLYGDGTPIIRYTGIDDLVTLSNEHCDCGLSGGLIKKIHGRETHSIVLPDKRILLPSSFGNFWGELANKINMDKIDDYQLIQHEIDKIEILIKIDEEFRNTDPSVEKILTKIKQSYKERFGSDVDLIVTEVEDFKPNTSVIISKVDKNCIKEKMYV